MNNGVDLSYLNKQINLNYVRTCWRGKICSLHPKIVELWSVRRKQINKEQKSFRKGGEGREEKNKVEVSHRVGQLIILFGRLEI